MRVENQTAILAKIKGFDKPCLHYLDKSLNVNSVSQHNEDGLNLLKNSDNFMCKLGYTSLPTQSELQTWLRNVYKVHIEVNYDENDFYEVSIDGIRMKEKYAEYEDALEDGLINGLMMLVKIVPFTSNEGDVGEFIEVDSETNFCGNYKHLGKEGCFLRYNEDVLSIVLSGTDDLAYGRDFDSKEELHEELNRLRKIQPINEETDILPFYYRD